MKTNQRIKHITSVVLIGIMLFTCLSLCRPQQRGRIRGCRKNSNDLRYHERKGDIAVADGEVMAEVPVKVKTADGMTTIDAVMEAFS